MNQKFIEFINNITLTASQKIDATVKYTNVCNCLYKHFYTGKYDADKKYLFGSYKTHTNVRPMTKDQDVDVLFKIPEEVYNKYKDYSSNGPEALLQEVRETLKDTFTTTDKIKAWGKVVLINFANNHHNVEVLPAFENEDGTFTIPNSENGGSWDSFDPRKEVKKFEKSNQDTDGMTQKMAKMLKAWAHNNTSMTYKSYMRLNDIISFLDFNYEFYLDIQYDKIIFDFFDYLRVRCSSNISTYVNTAYKHAQKALEYRDQGDLYSASLEWRKIFGTLFPMAENSNTKPERQIFVNPARPWSN